ncbi:MAG: hypothetical protein IJO09_09460 [Oscillospiraceae bacterium]|nr:hypothetical protein [Oscillospiraceae bacterium]
MKKILALILAALMMITMFAACGDDKKEETKEETKKETKKDSGIDEEDFVDAAEKAFSEAGREAISSLAELDFSDDEMDEIEKIVDEMIEIRLKKSKFKVSDIEVDGDKATATVSGYAADEDEANEMLEEKIAEYEIPDSEFEQTVLVLALMSEVMEEIDYDEEEGGTGEFEKDGDEWVMTNPEIFND